jgi:hypothetical protein
MHRWKEVYTHNGQLYDENLWQAGGGEADEHWVFVGRCADVEIWKCAIEAPASRMNFP